MLRKLVLLLMALMFICETVSAQEQEQNPNAFYFDAVVFKGNQPETARIDVYTVVPYESLYFVNSGTVFGAKYNITITVMDSTGEKILTKSFEKLVKEEDYFVSQGGTGKFDYTQNILSLKKGNYKLRVTLNDELNKAVNEKSRTLGVLNFDEFNLSVSGILLLSSIEEDKGKFKITPHVSDNIGNLKDGFFAFLEIYKKSAMPDTIDLVYEIFDSSNKYVSSGPRVRKVLDKPRTQTFLRIPKLSEFAGGIYTLKVACLIPSNSEDWKVSEYLAVAQRSIKNVQSIGGVVLNDIGLAIKELKYVALQKDIDFIDEAKTNGEKSERLQQFWKKLDPTPETERNEAFEEYYSRVDYANKNFKSSYAGWLSDKGMVYIVYGPPLQTNRQSSYDGRQYEIWTYPGGREFVFMDSSSFGDYRLVRPLGVTDKYKYSGN